MTDKLPRCPICGLNLSLGLARGRKSGKPFIMLICPKDGRHLRGFINDWEFVGKVIRKLEDKQQADRNVNGQVDTFEVLQN